MNGKKDNPLVTKTYDVIIPVKDGERFIKSAVNSVLNQTILPVSVIIVNDSSVDKTQERVEELFSQASSVGVTIKWIDSNGVGVSAARNTGINRSESEVIALLDCDDLWLDQKMETQLIYLESNVLVHCGYILVDEEENFIRQQTESRAFTPQALFEMEYQVSGSASAVIFKKSDFAQIAGFDEELIYSEDFDVWLQFAEIGSIFCVSEYFVKIRKHDTSTQSSIRNHHSRIDNLESLLYVWDKNRVRDVTGSVYKNCKPPLRMWIEWFFLEAQLNLSRVRNFERALFSREGIDRVKRLKRFDFNRFVYWNVYFQTLVGVFLYRLDKKIGIRALKKLSFILGRPMRKIRFEYQKFRSIT